MLRNWKLLVLKLSALFSFCGGPLYVWNRWTREEAEVDGLSNGEIANRHPVLFVILFLPIGMAILGYLVMVENDANDSISRWVLYGGGVGLFLVSMESVYALIGILLFQNGHYYNINDGRDDTTLVLIGCGVTFLTTFAYGYFARQWLQQRPESVAQSTSFSTVPTIEIT